MIDFKLPDFIPKPFRLRALPKENNHNSSFGYGNSAYQQHSPHIPSGPFFINLPCNLFITPLILDHWCIDIRENVFIRGGTDS
jgi:hypothetical protein